MPGPTAEQLDALLPQTQCERCGHPGCLPYARALVAGEALPNQCPPGGEPLARELATRLGVPALPLDVRHAQVRPGRIARIDAAACIGCARCLPPCPVDAILGSQRALHAVIGDWCTGCELCLPACPVDCIHMDERAADAPLPPAEASRTRHRAHLARAEARHARRASEVHGLKALAGTAPVAGEP